MLHLLLSCTSLALQNIVSIYMTMSDVLSVHRPFEKSHLAQANAKPFEGSTSNTLFPLSAHHVEYLYLSLSRAILYTYHRALLSKAQRNCTGIAQTHITVCNDCRADYSQQRLRTIAALVQRNDKLAVSPSVSRIQLTYIYHQTTAVA